MIHHAHKQRINTTKLTDCGVCALDANSGRKFGICIIYEKYILRQVSQYANVLNKNNSSSRRRRS